MKRWLENIRSSNESTKQAWTIILTLASSVLVAVLWMGYITVSMPEIAQPKERLLANARAAARTAAASPKTPGVTKTFTAGASAIAENIGLRLSRGIGAVRAMFGPRNTIEVRGVKQNFVLEGMEEIPSTPLP